MRKNICLLLSAIFLICFAFGSVWARREMITYAYDGITPLFSFDIADEVNEHYPDGKNSDWWGLEQGHFDSLQIAADYWASLLGNLPTNSAPARIAIGNYDYMNDDAISDYGPNGNGKTTLVAAILDDEFSDYYEGANPNYVGEAYAQIRIGRLTFPYWDHFGPMYVLPDNFIVGGMAAILVHEMGHAMGIMSRETMKGSDLVFYEYVPGQLNNFSFHLYDSFGTHAAVNQKIEKVDINKTDPANFSILADGYAFFQGTNVMGVLDGAIHTENNPHNVEGIPVVGYEDDDTDLAHLELRNSMMSHQDYRNWNTLMEAELALLQDIGINLDRRNFYGYSIYNNSVNVSVSNNFYARNATGADYEMGAFNETPWTIGLHIYGTSNTVNMQGEVLTKGYASVGIRVDGWNNDLTISNNIQADGDHGTGVMIAYGKDHKVSIAQNANITANGDDGVGIRFDFGENILGAIIEYRGSYKKRRGNFTTETYWDHTYWNMDDLLYELDGAMVSKLDISGIVEGKYAAIYIANNAFIKEINILKGAQIKGDIISDWAPTFEFRQISDIFDYVQYYTLNYNVIIGGQPQVVFGNLQDLNTNINFGNDSEPDFDITYNGNIIGRKSLNVAIVSGKLTYAGKMELNSFKLNSDTQLYLVFNPTPVSIEASSIFIDSAEIIADVNNFYDSFSSIDSPIYSVLQLKSDNEIVAQDMITTVLADEAQARHIAVGFYDYYGFSVGWNKLDSKNWNLDLALSGQVLNEEKTGKAVAGTPLRIALNNPTGNFSFRHSESLLTSLQTSPETLVFKNGDISSNGDHFKFWISPNYNYTKGLNGLNYQIHSNGFAFGIDDWISENFFLGIAMSLDYPKYETEGANIDAKITRAIISAGTAFQNKIELSLFAANGTNSYDQVRVMDKVQYTANYSAKQYEVGMNLTRSFDVKQKLRLKPFISYEYANFKADDYTESQGENSLHYNNGEALISQRLNTGTKLSYDIIPGFIASGRIFYSGLFGDRQAKAVVSLADGKEIASQGKEADKDSIGLGLDFDFSLSRFFSLGLGYIYLGSSHQENHNVSLDLSLHF